MLYWYERGRSENKYNVYKVRGILCISGSIIEEP